MLKLNVRSSASADLAEALAYYAKAAPALPDAFLTQLGITLTLLRQRPNVGSRRFAHFFPGIDLRTWSLERFPFRVFYMVEGDTLHVLRVDHERRNVTSKTLGPLGRMKKGGGR
ncbi:type II toxin-antitoxin system RelE/ParE family toxin [Rugamonas sp. CCM 8940]|uniref:type II toxin-antitoxin system RelE/ParE family toxin n=1 Tax=Rugamonas sp. CCM 8940 TaxID=2765359 RepID=UPI0018F78D75|nr:type II toxin-antitoxin system RelE/ParE family toxin [Rugamonas sp. CCM 8940]